MQHASLLLLLLPLLHCWTMHQVMEQSITALHDPGTSIKHAMLAGFICICQCRTPALIMEWALFELKKGHDQHARRLFQQGGAIDPPHPPLLTAWAQFEASQGQQQEARRIQALADACDTSVVYRRL